MKEREGEMETEKAYIGLIGEQIHFAIVTFTCVICMEKNKEISN